MSINGYIAKQFSNPEGFGGNLVSLIMNRQNRPLYDETIRLLPLEDSDSVLDIGCGNGYVLNLLARRHNAEFAGIDKSADIIEAAARRNRVYVESKKNELCLPRFKLHDVSGQLFQQGIYNKYGVFLERP